MVRPRINLGTLPALAVAGFLVDLQLVDLRSELGQDLIGFLVVLELGSNEVCEVPERLGGIKDLTQLACGHTQMLEGKRTFFMTP